MLDAHPEIHMRGEGSNANPCNPREKEEERIKEVDVQPLTLVLTLKRCIVQCEVTATKRRATWYNCIMCAIVQVRNFLRKPSRYRVRGHKLGTMFLNNPASVGVQRMWVSKALRGEAGGCAAVFYF